MKLFDFQVNEIKLKFIMMVLFQFDLFISI